MVQLMISATSVTVSAWLGSIRAMRRNGQQQMASIATMTAIRMIVVEIAATS